MEKRYLNIDELSSYIGISKGTLYVWVCRRKIPFLKLGGLLKFDKHIIDEWMRSKFIPEKDFDEKKIIL